MSWNHKTTVYVNPSVADSLSEATSVEELYAALMEANATYTEASAKTRRLWRKRADRIADALRTKLIVVP